MIDCNDDPGLVAEFKHDPATGTLTVQDAPPLDTPVDPEKNAQDFGPSSGVEGTCLTSVPAYAALMGSPGGAPMSLLPCKYESEAGHRVLSAHQRWALGASSGEIK